MKALMHLVVVMTLAMFSFGCGGGDTDGGGDTADDGAASDTGGAGDGSGSTDPAE